jgi:hypothetical protein
MNFFRKLWMMALVGGISLAWCHAGLGATMVTATFNGEDIANPVTGYVPVNGSPVDVYISGLSWTGSGNSDPAFNGSFTTYCIDLTHEINPNNPYTFTEDASLSDIVGATAAAQISTLYSNYDPGIVTPDTPETEGAFQMAIWDILYNNGAPFPSDGSTGSPFYVNSPSDAGSVVLANNWLFSLGSLGSSNPSLVALATYEDSQGQVFLSNSLEHDTVVPQPAMMNSSLLLLTLTAAGALLRRKFARIA